MCILLPVTILHCNKIFTAMVRESYDNQHLQPLLLWHIAVNIIGPKIGISLAQSWRYQGAASAISGLRYFDVEIADTGLNTAIA